MIVFSTNADCPGGRNDAFEFCTCLEKKMNLIGRYRKWMRFLKITISTIQVNAG